MHNSPLCTHLYCPHTIGVSRFSTFSFVIPCILLYTHVLLQPIIHVTKYHVNFLDEQRVCILPFVSPYPEQLYCSSSPGKHNIHTLSIQIIAILYLYSVLPSRHLGLRSVKNTHTLKLASRDVAHLMVSTRAKLK